MKKIKKRKNYLETILTAIPKQQLSKGVVSVVTVKHDDWCDMLKGKGACNCNPDVEFDGKVSSKS